MSKCRENKCTINSRRSKSMQNGTYNGYESYEQALKHKSNELVKRHKANIEAGSTSRYNKNGYCEHYYRSYS